MNRQEFEDTAKRYREELFRMYAGQNLNPPPKPEPPAAPPVQEPKSPAPQPEAAAPLPEPPSGIPPAPQNIPEEPAEPALPKRAYTGFIRVHTVTAEGARPVAGAAVTITHFSGGEPELIALQTTDDSGETETVTVPAPPPSEDQRRPASFLYDISVQAEGYYREHSTDIPVFPNVTSVQTFILIPLPAGSEEPVPGGDLTFYNNMQQY
ncbi:MAG: carboxypeptidase-like regulatory domain-containing protein [Oscillospiraceae bacterium]|nr:carboxypeptidase regulatory-like domain-containing protein [Oscillospiraceae bacterium]MCR4760888.1 carboxypeptidase-like regulatory domain-containing protein [Oscillospiraceae bacterium]